MYHVILLVKLGSFAFQFDWAWQTGPLPDQARLLRFLSSWQGQETGSTSRPLHPCLVTTIGQWLLNTEPTSSTLAMLTLWVRGKIVQPVGTRGTDSSTSWNQSTDGPTSWNQRNYDPTGWNQKNSLLTLVDQGMIVQPGGTGGKIVRQSEPEDDSSTSFNQRKDSSRVGTRG